MELSRCVFVLFLSITNPPTFVSSHTSNPLVLLVSFDAFRWDYLDMVKNANRHTPTFDMLWQNGSIASSGVKNSFSTKTFPNHYSIVTGMYEASHGVVGNQFYDPIRKELYNGFNTTQRVDPYYWTNGTEPDDVWEGEPIWITNQKATTQMLRKSTGAMMWPGCDVKIKGQYPSRYLPFTKKLSFKNRIDQLVEWFTDTSLPINLGLIYFEEPDESGHKFGPNSEEMIDMIVSLDGILKYLIHALKEHDLFDHLNLIVTSDHGMAETTKQIDLDDYVDSSLYLKAGGTPVAHIWPNEGKEDELYERFKSIPNLKTYRKAEIPPDYNYRFNHRVPPILLVAEEGYNIFETVQNKTKLGNHGYNNSLPDMHPLFIAHGPAFKQSYTFKKQFNNVDIYPLLCHILELTPAKHEGSLEEVKHMLVTEEDEDEEEAFFTFTSTTFLLVMVFAALFSGIFCVAAFRTNRIHLRKLRIPLASYPLNGIAEKESETHLLDSEEEEIP